MMRVLACLALIAAAMAIPHTGPAITVTFNAEWLNRTATTHYEDPKPSGCSSDEVSIQIQGVAGDFCTPKCAKITNACPKDLPAGATATPQCALQDSSTNTKYCALICNPSSMDAECGTNASCKSIQGTGVCTYDD